MGMMWRRGWLLCEAARVLEDRQLMDRANRLALDVTDACLAEGLSDKGYMMYEKEGRKNNRACLMVGARLKE